MKTNIVGLRLGIVTLVAIGMTAMALVIFKPMPVHAASQREESLLQEQVTHLKRIAEALEKMAGTRQR